MGATRDTSDTLDAAGLAESHLDIPTEHYVVVLVEDSQDTRVLMSEYLRLVGFAVLEAENADQAAAIVDSGVRVDLVCTDLDMPGTMNGQGLASWLAANRPQLPVIIYSGAGLPAFKKTSLRRFLLKPVSLETLERQISELIASSTTHSWQIPL